MRVKHSIRAARYQLSKVYALTYTSPVVDACWRLRRNSSGKEIRLSTTAFSSPPSMRRTSERFCELSRSTLSWKPLIRREEEAVHRVSYEFG